MIQDEYGLRNVALQFELKIQFQMKVESCRWRWNSTCCVCLQGFKFNFTIIRCKSFKILFLQILMFKTADYLLIGWNTGHWRNVFLCFSKAHLNLNLKNWMDCATKNWIWAFYCHNKKEPPSPLEIQSGLYNSLTHLSFRGTRWLSG